MQHPTGRHLTLLYCQDVEDGLSRRPVCGVATSSRDAPYWKSAPYKRSSPELGRNKSLGLQDCDGLAGRAFCRVIALDQLAL
jgi:hypothetical protein